tara:strand:- start:261 stop:899 length:639 start_codon:yes stop_codon:yes gene_type:complete
MRIKAILLDFDGTLVTKDLLDVICGINGKEKESKQLNQDFLNGKVPGLDAITQRINFLKGISLNKINKKLDEKSYLMRGAKELADFANKNKIKTILHSGNIVPILDYYKEKLGLTYTLGNTPRMKGNIIQGIKKEDFPGREFKLIRIKEISKKLKIKPHETIAIGDSPADKPIFDFAGKSIAINPKEGIEKHADYTIKSLKEAIPIIEDLKQ